MESLSRLQQLNGPMTQKLMPTSSSLRKKHQQRHQAASIEDEPWTAITFPTNFNEIVGTHPPQAPPGLTRLLGTQQSPVVRQNTGRVKAMLRVCPVDGTRSSFLVCDEMSKQVTVLDQSVNTTAAVSSPSPASSRRRTLAPKMFMFDAVFSQDSSLSEICATSLVDIIQAVVGGQDGCVFSYGHARLGKTYTMLGVDDSPQNLGVIPCAIAWLYRLIDDRKESSSTRFSVRVSALEVTGKQETLTDLLADIARAESGTACSSGGVILKEDPVSGIQLENQSELRAPSARHASFYLDAAIASRTIPEIDDDARNSHLLFTLNVYQYRVDQDNSGQDEVVGGRSRLHLLDLGSCSRGGGGGGKNTSGSNSALSLSSLGNVLLALLNGQRHVPHRDSKLAQLLWDALSGSTSLTAANCCIIAHVSPADHAFIETLQVIQLASRIFRIRVRKKNKPHGNSSDDSSLDGSVVPYTLPVGRSPRRTTLQHVTAARRLNGTTPLSGSSTSGSSRISSSDFESSSEQSCDTVIYVGKNGRMLSDRELTDNEGPPVRSASSNASKPESTTSLVNGGDLHGNSFNLDQHRDIMLTADGQAHRNSPARASKTRQEVALSTKQKALFQTPMPLATDVLPLTYGIDEVRPVKVGDDLGVSITQPLTSAASMENGTAVAPSSGKIRRKVRRPPLTTTADGGVDGEQWIDGPNAEMPPQQKTIATSVVALVNCSIAADSTASTSGLVNAANARDNEDGERWIDGPPEFRADSHSSPSGASWVKPPVRQPKCLPDKSIASNRSKQVGNETCRCAEKATTFNSVPAKGEGPSKSPIRVTSNVTRSKTEKCSTDSTLVKAEQTGDDLDVTDDLNHGASCNKQRHRSQHHTHCHHHSTKKGLAPNCAAGGAVQACSPSRSGRTTSAPSPSPASPRHFEIGHTGRVAQWVRSVQAATAIPMANSDPATVSPGIMVVPSMQVIDSRLQTWQSSARNNRKSPFRLRSAERAFRDPFGFLIDSFDSESDATGSIGNNSPPPDYASCIAADRRITPSSSTTAAAAAQMLDINENEPSVNGGHIPFCEASSVVENAKRVGSFDWPPGCVRQGQRSFCSMNYVPSPLLFSSTSQDFIGYTPSNSCTSSPPGLTSTTVDAYDVFTWPRRHQSASTECGDPAEQTKRLHHPDGASDPKLSVLEVARPLDLEPLKVLSSIGFIQQHQLASVSPCLQSFTTSPYLRSAFDDAAERWSKKNDGYSNKLSATTTTDDNKKHSMSQRDLKEELLSRGDSMPQIRAIEVSSEHDTSFSNSTSFENSSLASRSTVVADLKARHRCEAQLIEISRSTSAGNSACEPQTKSSSNKPVERCRSSSPGVSLLSCISPRRRARTFAELFTRHRALKERSDGAPSTLSVGFDVTASDPEPCASSSADATGSPPNTACCMHDSDHGSSSSDYTMPLPPPKLAFCSSVEADTSSGYGSVQIDGEPPLTNTGLLNGSTANHEMNGHGLISEPQVGKLCNGTKSVADNCKFSVIPRDRSEPIIPSSVCTCQNHEGEVNDSPEVDQSQTISAVSRQQKITELLTRQQALKADLASAKTTLMVDPDSWSFDLHVAQQLDHDNPGYVEALERETAILEKRVVACKSRIMLVTVFDITNT